MRVLAAIGLCLCAALASACGAASTDDETVSDPDGDELRANDSARGFTSDFRAFLASDRYASFDFARSDLEGASGYGGRLRPGDALTHDPVIFVHGNSDRGIGGKLGGWETSLAYFRAHGYGPHEVYTFTWGPANAKAAALQYHSKEHLTRVRTFIEAVLAYTGASRVDVLGHSMGVTLARKAILGGSASDMLAGGDYDLGAPLTDRVDTFVGIAGGNLGLTSCFFTGPSTPTCGSTNGFYPGTRLGLGPVVGRSAFLNDLLASPHAEGRHVFSIWSPGDEILGPGALVWGTSTGKVPAQDDEIVLDRSCGHMASKSETPAAQLALVNDHRAADAPASCAR